MTVNGRQTFRDDNHEMEDDLEIVLSNIFLTPKLFTQKNAWPQNSFDQHILLTKGKVKRKMIIFMGFSTEG